MGSDLVGEALAVSSERRLGGGVGEGAVPQRHPRLDRRDVHDGATARVDHAWKEAAIEPDRGEHGGDELLVPGVLAQGGAAAGWCCGASEVVDEDVDAAHAIECFGDGAAGTLR